MLDDPAILRKVKDAILVGHFDARSALEETLKQYAVLFARIEDEYLKERLADIRDVVRRIEANLVFEVDLRRLAVREPVVVVASEILPSQVIAFKQLPVAGIVTEIGGATGHSAILARSLGIPAPSGSGLA